MPHHHPPGDHNLHQEEGQKKGAAHQTPTGAVTLVQRFGGSLNLNVHYHMLFLEGGYYDTHQGPRYWWFLNKRGYFNDEYESALPEEEMSQGELLPELQAASVQSRIAMGERKDQRGRRLGVPELKIVQIYRQARSGRRAATDEGFW